MNQPTTVTDRARPIWPFPGSSRPWWESAPPHNLPPPVFQVGDRVDTRWGTATVLKVHDWELFASRAYHLRFDWATGPAGFGHTWSEDDMQPAPPRATSCEHIEQINQAHGAPQLELFA